MVKEIPNCKRFTGYKPCFPGYDCMEEGCKDYLPVGKKILIINLDAMGDVLMTTAQLLPLKKKFPESTIYWITLENAAPLLQHNPYIDFVLSYNFDSVSILKAIKFDLILNVDKSVRAGALTMDLPALEKLGFGLNENGAIKPLNKGAEYNYKLGMDDNLKFKINIRFGQDFLAETFDLKYNRDDYVFQFTNDELKFIDNYMSDLDLNIRDEIIGFNTGCSTQFPNKKMTIEQHLILIERLLSYNRFKILLLGGPEDTERNQIIEDHFKGKIINTPTNQGIRKGACYENIPQVVITGDSFGMHLAIALKKYVIAWFGLSCWTEIDLYDRGIKIFPDNLDCAPCWKKECPYNLECIDQIDLNKIVDETVKYFDNKRIA